jgi:alpha-glucosidase (family GH31 glycosyl hydrolase)
MHGSRGINCYPLIYERAYNRFLKTHRGEDYVLFSRAGYTGAQQVSCHWTGDESSTWDAFRATLRAMLNVGLCGVSFIGWDIAGFAGSIPSSELYLRAAAFSVFCPIMQFHSDYNARREPSRDRTPWNIQELTGDPEVISVFRQLTNLRMNLIPYILGQALKSSQSGLPLMRALPLDFPSSATCREFPYEYMFGDALLVVPVMEKGKSAWEVFLPEGEWRDLWTGAIFKGNQEFAVPVPKERIPVYQRRGSIVPLNLGETLELCSPVGNSPVEIKNLAALVYPGDACRVDVYQGKGFPYGDISTQQVEENGQIKVVLKGLKYPVNLLILGNEPSQVSVNETLLQRLEDCVRSSDAFWVWMPDRYMAYIHLPPHKGTAVVILS